MRTPPINRPELVAALFLVAVIAFALSSAFASGNIQQHTRNTGTPSGVGVPIEWATLAMRPITHPTDLEAQR